MSRRDQIQMIDEEVGAFLEEMKVITCATNGADGFPHLMPLWFLPKDGDIWAWTFTKSQKIRNLQRDPRATLQLEAGEQYQELRGAMFKTNVTLHDDLDFKVEIGIEIGERYGGAVGRSEELLEVIRKQASKRAVMQFVVVERATFDHSKLGGGY